MENGSNRVKSVKQVINVAHRGAAGYAPENTIAAFELAMELKADFIELDVHLSKDGELVVIHDDTVNRTTNGTGNVRDYTFMELQKFDAGRWLNEKYAGQRIPALHNVLELFGSRAGFLIEIKSPWLYPGIEQKLAEQLKLYYKQSKHTKVIVQSFDAASMKRFHTLYPDVPVGLLVSSVQDITVENLRSSATFADYINPSIGLVTKDSIKAIHSFGMKSFAWTVRSKTDVQPLLEAGVDGIISDYPDYILE
jgi:glycerophosphoryl diester phosphodiesterase